MAEPGWSWVGKRRMGSVVLCQEILRLVWIGVESSSTEVESYHSKRSVWGVYIQMKLVHVLFTKQRILSAFLRLFAFSSQEGFVCFIPESVGFPPNVIPPPGHEVQGRSISCQLPCCNNEAIYPQIPWRGINFVLGFPCVNIQSTWKCLMRSDM